VPIVNWALAIGTLIAVIGFGSSRRWRSFWNRRVAAHGHHDVDGHVCRVAVESQSSARHPRQRSLLALDLLFVTATSTKLVDGGWFPLLISFIIAFLMLTWRRGQEIMDRVRLEVRENATEFIARIKASRRFALRAPPS